MSLMIGIVSYLPRDNEKVRIKRAKGIHRQLQWLRDLYPNIKPTVVAQSYDETDYEEGKADYIRFDAGIGAGAARNKILEIFYAGDKDFLLLCDDDSISYPYYHYEDFMHHIAESPEDFKGIDSIIGVEPEYYPFKKQVYEDPKNLTHYKFRPRYKNSGAQLNFLRNIVKEGHEPIYFNNMDAAKGEGREDIEFNLRWVIAGFTSYEMQTWIKKSMSFDQSSIFGDDTKARDAVLAIDLRREVERFKDYGLDYKKENVIDWKAFNDKWDKSKELVYIPRRQSITISEKEMPKYHKSNSIKLF